MTRQAAPACHRRAGRPPWPAAVGGRCCDHSSTDYRGRIMALWVYVYLGTTPVGSIITGAITSAAGPRVALLTGAAACLVAAAIASRMRTPPPADAALTDLTSA